MPQFSGEWMRKEKIKASPPSLIDSTDILGERKTGGRELFPVSEITFISSFGNAGYS